MSHPDFGFGFGREGLNGSYDVNGTEKGDGGYGDSLKEDHRFL